MIQRPAYLLIMVDQADLSAVALIEERDERVIAAFERLTTHADETQSDLRDDLRRRNIPYEPYYLVNSIKVTAHPYTVRSLERRADVDRVLTAFEIRPERNWGWLPDPQLTTLARLFEGAGHSDYDRVDGLAWGVESVRADEVWLTHNVTGEGIIIGNLDTGVDWTHPDLRNTYRGENEDHDYHWLDLVYGVGEPVDGDAHGTHTTGIHSGENGIGVAPGTNWIACRPHPYQWAGASENMACWQFLFAPYPQGGDAFSDGNPRLGAHLTNNSWVCGLAPECDGKTLGIAVEQLRLAGVMTIMAAGNDGPECDTVRSPSATDGAYSVGAYTSGHSVASFSSRGPGRDVDGASVFKPDILAPGREIWSAFSGGGYAAYGGTSQATPHLTGVIALMWSANPNLIGNIEATEAILRISSHPVEGTQYNCGEGNALLGENNDFGAGRVDAFIAVTHALETR